MNEIAFEAPSPPGRVRQRAAAWLTVPKHRFIAAGLVVALVLLLGIAGFSLPFGAPPKPGISALRELPARPEDMEKHGKLAVTTLSPGDARARNGQVAFDPRLGTIARPFTFSGSDVDRERATQCLAAAVLYEAGDEGRGEAAVAQVVLNRVRHPAFPATVCGVVYQGSERATGCQFTFTCDGSLHRQMGDDAWQRARIIARRALSGYVDDTVGLATHYHTDWVYPYWSPSLRKLTKVGTHLFFGWPGSWGAQGAFSKLYRGHEPAIGTASVTALAVGVDDDAAVSATGEQPGILGLPQKAAKLPEGMGAVPLYGNKVRLVRPDGRAFGLLSPPGTSASQIVNAALALCGEPGPCRVDAWDNEDDIPGAYPIPAQTRSTMVFEYVREGSSAAATTRFDCTRFPNKNPKSCLETSGDVPDVLAGVRFR